MRVCPPRLPGERMLKPRAGPAAQGQLWSPLQVKENDGGETPAITGGSSPCREQASFRLFLLAPSPVWTDACRHREPLTSPGKSSDPDGGCCVSAGPPLAGDTETSRAQRVAGASIPPLPLAATARSISASLGRGR